MINLSQIWTNLLWQFHHNWIIMFALSGLVIAVFILGIMVVILLISNNQLWQKYLDEKDRQFDKEENKK